MRNYILHLLLLIAVIPSFISCSSNDDDTPTIKRRTAIIFMNAEHNLDFYPKPDMYGNLTYSYFHEDLEEIARGAKSIPSDCNLLVFFDRSKSAATKEEKHTMLPSIIQFKSNGDSVVVKRYDKDFLSCDPQKMKEVLQWIVTNYPAESYGITFWGHGDGWIMKPSSIAFNSNTTRSWGYDSGYDSNETGKWINIPALRDVLESVPHLDYIFFDCCFMQGAEVAYELRNTCDYIIASPAEIPGSGAPYKKILPDLFLEKEMVGRKIIDDYINYTDFGIFSGLPISVIKTSNLDALGQATEKALDTFMADYQYPNQPSLKGLIYYYREHLSNFEPMMYDMRDFMHRYLSASDFAQWDIAYRNAVPYAVYPPNIQDTGKKNWMNDDSSIAIDFYSFYFTNDNYGGLSMFIPQNEYRMSSSIYLNPNSSYKSMQWSKYVDWSKWGY